MDTIKIYPSPFTTLRRSSLEVPKAVSKPAASALRGLSLTSQPRPLQKKTVTFDRPPEPLTHSLASSIIYNIHTAYLFASKDIKTILVPQILFGILNAYSSATHLQSPYSPTPAHTTLLLRLALRTPLIIGWTLLNLLPFCIDNQRQPGAIAEDAINRPSRPLPAKRLSPEQAQRWMWSLYAVAFALSCVIGGEVSVCCVALMGLGWLYNDCQISESGWVGRNVLTALGYAGFGVGATMIAMPATLSTSAGTHVAMTLDANTWSWIVILAAVIGTTGQLTDLADFEGDRARGRLTAPIVMGEELARWTVIVPVGVWSVVCPWFWEAKFLGFLLPVMVGKKIVERLLTKTDAGEHKRTFHLWNLWVVILYVLPLLTTKP